MQNFTPISAFIGGCLIGTSAVLLFWLNGKIAGISGIFHGLYPPKKHDFLWRILFLFGLVIGSWVYFLIPPIQFEPRTHFPIYLLLIAGVLVGIGTKLSGGCTSGHGVCGIARFSRRSFASTLVFIIFAMITVFVTKHLWVVS